MGNTLNKAGLEHLAEVLDEKYGKPIPQALVKTTYAELKALRDGSKLVPGTWYRITDYECTTTQENTRSAGHRFDVIVLALDNKTLSEEARACLHEGDTYFGEAGAKLEAWKIWYCLDNDETRFAWADTSGKGVIYRMIDEWNNDVPYDFKNIQFVRAINEDGKYDPENGEDTWVFTFAGRSYHVDNDEYSDWKDGSLESPYGHMSDENTTTFVNNVIKPYIYLYDEKDEDITKCGIRKLNDIVMSGYWEEIGSTEGEDAYYYAYCCHSNTFGNNCYRNTLGGFCRYNTFGADCSYNTFESDCSYNTFGADCKSNKLGRYCNTHTFGDYCNYNTFESDCKSNKLGDECSYNTFGNYCSYNTFAQYCNYNTFGTDCSSNTLCKEAKRNTFGNYCKSNKLGDNCSYNTFGNYCKSNKLGDNCSYNTFGTSLSTKDYMQYITLENGVSNTYINCSATTSMLKYGQNAHVNSGVSGTSAANRKTLTISTAGNNYLTTFGSANDTTINV